MRSADVGAKAKNGVVNTKTAQRGTSGGTDIEIRFLISLLSPNYLPIVPLVLSLCLRPLFIRRSSGRRVERFAGSTFATLGRMWLRAHRVQSGCSHSERRLNS